MSPKFPIVKHRRVHNVSVGERLAARTKLLGVLGKRIQEVDETDTMWLRSDSRLEDRDGHRTRLSNLPLHTSPGTVLLLPKSVNFLDERVAIEQDTSTD